MARLRGEAVTTAQVNKVDKLRPSRAFGHPKFVMAHHPNSWEFKNGQWLPRIKQHHIYPGVNGTDKNGNHALMLAQLQMDGWTVLSHDLPVCFYDDDGELVDDVGYMVRYDGTRGPIYKDVWAIPAIYGAGASAKTVWDHDEAGYDAWRARLVEQGIVAAPSPHVLAGAVDLQLNRMTRDQNNAHMPIVAKQIEKESARYESMKASVDKMVETLKPQPRKALKRGKAASV